MHASRFSVPFGHLSAAAGLATGLALWPASAPAAQYQLVHSFCIQSNCQDGRNPQAGLIRDSEGNFYGTAEEGGNTGVGQNGVAYKLTFNSSTQQYDYQVLYNFCSQPNCTDGQFPNSPLIMDIDGNLYGTTQGGGSGAPDFSTGIIYELVRSEGYALHVLHDFCATSDCEDGTVPDTGLTYQGQETGALYDGVSNLYGTTVRTIARGDGSGVAYELKPGQGLFYRLLHSFCLTDCADGQFPSNLTMDSHGRLYGVTTLGGAAGHGVLFKLRPHTKELKILYNFCSQPACADGDQPDIRQTLVRDSGGNFYGTTSLGGAHNEGTVWKFHPRGRQLTVLYSFCAQAGCTDGKEPREGVTLGPAGEVFGTTPTGGACDFSGAGCGVVFELQDSTYTVLHSFCADGGSCAADGAQPFGSLLLDPSGTLFGTTDYGGASGAGSLGGTVFSVTP